MATTNDYISAQNDLSLITRFTAKAQMLGVDSADSWVRENYSKLLAFEPAQGQTIVDVYAAAKAARQQAIDAVPEEPGSNLSAVTDAFMESAIGALTSGA